MDISLSVCFTIVMLMLLKLKYTVQCRCTSAQWPKEREIMTLPTFLYWV